MARKKASAQLSRLIKAQKKGSSEPNSDNW